MSEGARRVLIAGCGYVGTALGERLAASGWRVFGLRRRPEGLPAGIEPVRADLGAPASLRGLPGPFDAAVYAVGAEERSEEAYRRAYVDGLRHLLAALDASPRRGDAGPPRVIFTSSTSVYGQDAGERVDERSPCEPRRFSGRILLEAEALLAERGDACALRLGGIYGPGRTRLVERVRRGEARRRPHPHFTNRIHRDDVAGALQHLLEGGALPPLPPVLLGVDTEPADEADVLRWLAAQLGVAEPPVQAGEGEGDVASGAPTGKRCSSARLVATGYRFRYPDFRRGYAALIEELA